MESNSMPWLCQVLLTSGGRITLVVEGPGDSAYQTALLASREWAKMTHIGVSPAGQEWVWYRRTASTAKPSAKRNATAEIVRCQSWEVPEPPIVTKDQPRLVVRQSA